MSNSRNRGHTYERKIVNELKEIGFGDVVTSRAESRNMDAKKVDVFGKSLPIHIQCKNTKDVFKVSQYYELNEEFFPDDKPVVIFHKKTKKAKTKFVTEGEFVYLKKEDFYKLLEMLIKTYG